MRLEVPPVVSSHRACAQKRRPAEGQVQAQSQCCQWLQAASWRAAASPEPDRLPAAHAPEAQPVAQQAEREPPPEPAVQQSLASFRDMLDAALQDDSVLGQYVDVYEDGEAAEVAGQSPHSSLPEQRPEAD